MRFECNAVKCVCVCALLETDCFLTTFLSLTKPREEYIRCISTVTDHPCYKQHKTFYGVANATKFILTTNLMRLVLGAFEMAVSLFVYRFLSIFFILFRTYVKLLIRMFITWCYIAKCMRWEHAIPTHCMKWMHLRTFNWKMLTRYDYYLAIK